MSIFSGFKNVTNHLFCTCFFAVCVISLHVYIITVKGYASMCHIKYDKAYFSSKPLGHLNEYKQQR